MAFDKDKMRRSLLGRFNAIEEKDRATEKVAAAIADAVAEALGDLEVEVHVRVKSEVAQVPATLEIDEMMKGGVR